MEHFALHCTGRCDIDLPGENLADALTRGFDAIARETNLGNAAGYRLEEVRAEYRQGILGGKGGVEVLITARSGTLYTGAPTPAAKSYTAWIEARPEDCPEPITLELNAR